MYVAYHSSTKYVRVKSILAFYVYPCTVQLFAKTLATALVEKNNLRDHEKLACRQNRVCSHGRPYR